MDSCDFITYEFEHVDERVLKYAMEFIIQPFEERGKGLAVMNRIRKASSGYTENLDSLRTYLN